jgi:cytoskeletal protein CcmA (bactofilin family)
VWDGYQRFEIPLRKGAIMSIDAGIIGKGIVIKGELTGEQDLIIEGRVEGSIALKKHLIVENTGVVLADLETENITIKGEMNGNMVASDMVEIADTAKVVGDIQAPRVIISDGARFRGSIDMDVDIPKELLS